RRGGAGLIQALAIAGIWVAVEYLRANLFTGIPWAQLGHSQYRWTGLIQVCDITGVYGISFLIVMVNYSLFRAIKCLSDRRACLACLVPAAGLVAAVLIYGSLRLPQFNSEDAPGPLTIAAIQGSVPQDQKWRNGNKARIMETHLGLTEKALKQGARLFIWPETTVQTYLQQKVPAPLTKLLRTYDAAAIVGGPRFAGGPENYTYYNSAYYLKGSGIDAIHNKRHLFPFGEYFPLGFVDILKLRYSAPRQYTPGEAITLFETPAGRAAVLICFEVIFSRLARDAVSAGADYLVIISNDAWFGKTSAHYQHFSMAVFTAVGFRRPLVRAANTGISGFIDPAGRIVERLAPFEEGIVLCEPQVNISVISFYCRFGDLFAWLCFLGFLGVFLPLTRTSK
ncbi:MAG: apolipoprotein N-acyltransferase, partial [Deltaproteobacteria bacterium]|nr:apolipoprotein N-acyltransferase [Deltaproteobacteria bacterium]